MPPFARQCSAAATQGKARHCFDGAAALCTVYRSVSPTMSDQPGNNGDREPLSKRQKCSDSGEEEAAEIIALGGPMYDEATARKILKEAVLLAAGYTVDGEALIGFDPDDAALDNVYYCADGYHDETPMIYFAQRGDAKMCRYLVSRGASTTKIAGTRNPTYVAAQQGHLEVCQFLQANGASHDIWKGEELVASAWTPFPAAAQQGHKEMIRWLVLKGALCADGSSEKVEGVRIYPNMTYYDNDIETWKRQLRNDISRECERLVEWAEEVTQSHSALVMFLLGTLPTASGKDQRCCILQCLSGHSGVRKHIADFVGLEVTKGRHLRILRQVVDALPSFIKD